MTNSPVDLAPGVLTLSITTRDTMESIEGALLSLVKARSSFRYLPFFLHNCISPAISLLMSAMFILFLGITGIFGDVLYDSLYADTATKAMTSISRFGVEVVPWALSIILLIFLSVIVHKLPALLRGEHDHLGPAFFALVSGTDGEERRLYRILHFLSRKKLGVQHVVIWNSLLDGNGNRMYPGSYRGL